MDIEETHHITYIDHVITFFKTLLANKEKKLPFPQSSLTSQWKQLLLDESNVYLIQIKDSLSLNEQEYFQLLFALSIEISNEVKTTFIRIFQSSYATIAHAITLYNIVHSTDVQNSLISIHTMDWDLLYTSSRKNQEYLHECRLFLQPWVLAYAMYGGVMRTPFIAFSYTHEVSYVSSEEADSFSSYAQHGIKAILSKEDEIQLIAMLQGMKKNICNIYLSQLPASWNARILISFCCFCNHLLSCSFFLHYHDVAQEKFLSYNIRSLPFSFLITSSKLVPEYIAILYMPYKIAMEDSTSLNPFVKEYAFEKTLPRLIGDATFLQRLEEFIEMAKYKNEIYRVISCDTPMKGISALFHGPSGNGKTLAARYIAKNLEKKLWQIELSNVLDKYIGESEKHLETIFNEAEKEGVILLFDEADTLFTKRTEVRDANDRYANAITSYLLQRMEAFSGIMILTSNYLNNFDDAFLRRITSILRFYGTTTQQRLEKWRVATENIQVDSSIHWDEIASIKLSYARIDQCIFTAISFMVTKHEAMLSQHHIEKAIIYELEKQGEMPPKGWSI